MYKNEHLHFNVTIQTPVTSYTNYEVINFISTFLYRFSINISYFYLIFY